MKVLIVEDEIRLADTLSQIMTENKYLVDTVNDGADGFDYAMSNMYDIIVLDVMLPKMNGFDVVRALRKAKVSTPVILLTAKDEVIDKITGLDSGADDYLTKPFVPDELLARIRALTRRQGEVVMNELSFSDLTLNLSMYMLQKDGKSIHLGHKEFEVMRLLITNPAMVVSKDEMISKIWGMESDAEDNNVEVYISFLRKKLQYLGSKVNISTQRKIGYFLEEGV
ncbi:DNA-binding response OmpR family regulator [Lachnotalea glycerini]|uniref:Stage 0 sporulation protein A homolog n=1 Tax=Lachnotalea glycerini TaxID=1763509 RepID=A0A255IPR0_9FIRM|nr:response regulator transcription factor [Lachnotalea glycerini]PXV96063.1 DNA-binding response OmpR family regulator [Lachnotalea glycerini]RDY30597.1 DNA-binding response regulator [Lachnotalea glycerini]